MGLPPNYKAPAVWHCNAGDTIYTGTYPCLLGYHSFFFVATLAPSQATPNSHCDLHTRIANQQIITSHPADPNISDDSDNSPSSAGMRVHANILMSAAESVLAVL
eukprot:TRINITY_DN10897_c0_g1_i1.p2 TRINITY_DN10897_c0_g1~~TRINITY_DN10897_c0_g1_i1.p2  ORF type:complete len:105 (+),score=7.64 TRINITY_DN10897_c0_g1_i1:153-467(+)